MPIINTNNENEFEVTEKIATAHLEKGFEKAEKLLQNNANLEKFLQQLESKLKIIPIVGDKLAVLPIMASLVKSYADKEYTKVPFKTLVAIVSALAYFLSPVDVIPDTIPGLGFVDDAVVIQKCWELVETDVRDYEKWRMNSNKVFDLE